jgi:hypothetical protein
VSASHRFSFAFDPTYRRTARLFGVTPDRAWVDVTDTLLDAHYGPYRLTTDLSNISKLAVTGPYNFFKTAGPPHLGITDLGLTFASNGRRGTLICFHRRVRGLGLLRHGELTVTVEDPDGLAEVLRELTSRRSQTGPGSE